MYRLMPNKRVILVSHPGIAYDTLRSMLESLPAVAVLGASGALSAYDLLKQQPADAVVIDTNVALAETIALVSRIKREAISTRCIVLIASSRVQTELAAAGADIVLIENCSPQQLEKAICAPNTVN